MINRVRTNSVLAVAAAFLMLTHSGETGVVSAAPEQYDPRRDPNYSRATSERTPVNWQAVWALVREFEARTYPNIAQSQMATPYAQPQPWHYVQGAPSFSGSLPNPDAPIYGGPYIGSSYAYGPSFSGWWQTSPRIPWWSLIPSRSHHGHGHNRVWQHHDRHHEWRGRHNW